MLVINEFEHGNRFSDLDVIGCRDVSGAICVSPDVLRDGNLTYERAVEPECEKGSHGRIHAFSTSSVL